MVKRLARIDRNTLTAAAIGLAVIFFLALNVLSNTTLTNARLDLTEQGLFTLSKGTKQVLSEIDEPITLRFYLSDALVETDTTYASYAQRVRELLETYAQLAGGMIRLEIYRPEPYSPEEDRAVADGLRAAQIGATGESVYFGLAGSNSTDDSDVIAFFSPERANLLEYEVTRLIHNLANPEKPVVAVLGALPLRGDQSTGYRPAMIMSTIEQFFEVRYLGGDVARVDDDVDILLVAQPSGLSEATLYGIDQFVLGGGRALVFVDPLAEALADPQQAAMPEPVAESFGPLLKAWGVELAPDAVVGDRLAARRVNALVRGRRVVTDYIIWLSLPSATLSDKDVATANLRLLNVNSAGILKARADAETTFEPLVSSTPESMQIDVQSLGPVPDPVELLARFEPAGEPFTIAARVSGPVKSAFPDGPPEAVTDKEARGAHRKQSAEPVNLILVADSDMLMDPTWLQADNLFGQQLTIPLANNGDFVVNALDNLSGSQGLIALRGRGVVSRPFEVVEAIERDAELRYRSREQQLVDRITQAEQEIQRLQQEEQASGVMLSAKQEQALDDLRADLIQARQELREVQRALRQDIESLEGWVKAVNIWGMPLVVGLVAIALALVRRRQAGRRAPAGA